MIRKLMFTAIFFTVLCVLAFAQNWGSRQEINCYGPGWPGNFNPSYCVNGSVLYYDGYFRDEFLNSGIYMSILDGTNCDSTILLPYPINTPEQPEIFNVMPYVTITGDSLFFCSDREGTYGGLDIWLSVRNEDDSWGEPVNLGDSVNSEFDEGSPHYADSIHTLFFDRSETDLSIYKTIYSDGGFWQEAERLPDIINAADKDTYDPSYDEHNNILYFNWDYAIYRSSCENSEWSEPELLNENINSSSGAFGANIGFDGQYLFFSNTVLEYYDFQSYIFYSEPEVSIDEQNTIPSDIDLAITIFPNPSNGAFKIAVVSTGSPYDLSIYNTLGQLVKEYNNNTSSSIIWNGTDSYNQPVASGIYLIKVASDRGVATQKLLFQK